MITINLLKALSKDVPGGDFHRFDLMSKNKEVHFFGSFSFMFSFCVLFSLSGLDSSLPVFTFTSLHIMILPKLL